MDKRPRVTVFNFPIFGALFVKNLAVIMWRRLLVWIEYKKYKARQAREA